MRRIILFQEEKKKKEKNAIAVEIIKTRPPH